MLVRECSWFHLLLLLLLHHATAASFVTHPSEVKALMGVKSTLIDPKNNLWNWNDNKSDPCTSNWTAVFCYPSPADDDGFLHVRELQLLNMNLSGTLAPELGQLSRLKILDFMWNDLSGSIPKEIGNISSLSLILLNGNKLSGPLPDELGYLSNLNRLQIDQNHISGPIPTSFAYLKSVKHLHFNNNSITGEIPTQLSTLPNLLHLLLDNNNLSGHLPPHLSNIPQMRILQLDNNNFSGSEIPASYGSMSKLAKLSLRNCSLRGAIPDLSGMLNLKYLDLSHNSLTGGLPTQLSDNMTTIDLSDNNLNGTIPSSFSNFPFLQKLLLHDNNVSGPIPAFIWQNMSFSPTSRLTIDLRNNMLSDIGGLINPPENVTLRLEGNPICNNAALNIGPYCASEAGGDKNFQISTNSTERCPIQACPVDNFYEYVPTSPVPCFCALPLRIGYRLKSPSFSYFPPYMEPFEEYVTKSLKLNLYELFIDSVAWEEGPRLRMYLKIFPAWSDAHSSTFNVSEVLRIRGIFSSWEFPGSDFFGPYELLNFTLLGPYAQMNIETHGRGIAKGVWVAIILGAIVCAIAVSALVSHLIARRHARHLQKLSRRHLSSRVSMKIDGVKCFSFNEMHQAANNFNDSSLVGRGGYGKVYRGILGDNTIVAIKRAEEGSLQGQKEFLTEIKLLSRLHHRNLVSLIGYCDEEGEQMLIYEFMPNGTLRDWISGKAGRKLDFGMRLSIATGAAKGILYLHTEANPPVFHRDIKASNILLDSKLNPKVADFGLSRLAPTVDDEGKTAHYISTVVKGTPGYLDPEYLLTHKLTDKSDVYSLGIVFLELLTGMQPISHGKNIVREVNMAHQSGVMFSIIDSKMGSYPSDCIERFAALALACCNGKPEKRPTMLDVVRELETILKMMPETTDSIFSESRAGWSGKSAPASGVTRTSSSSSTFYTSRDPYASSSSSSVMIGSDISSGVVSAILPR